MHPLKIFTRRSTWPAPQGNPPSTVTDYTRAASGTVGESRNPALGLAAHEREVTANPNPIFVDQNVPGTQEPTLERRIPRIDPAIKVDDRESRALHVRLVRSIDLREVPTQEDSVAVHGGCLDVPGRFKGPDHVSEVIARVHGICPVRSRIGHKETRAGWREVI